MVGCVWTSFILTWYAIIWPDLAWPYMISHELDLAWWHTWTVISMEFCMGECFFSAPQEGGRGGALDDAPRRGGRTRRPARQNPVDQGSSIKDKARIEEQGLRIKDQWSRIKDQGSRMKAGGRTWRPARQDPEDQGSRIKNHGPCFGMNEHPRRDTDVILRQSKAPIELFNSRSVL